jgi:hypothetical protein
MAADHVPFPAGIQNQALARQKFRCASCGTSILVIGEGFRDGHLYGERAEGHHVIPHKMGGPITLENCVVICRSCHMNAHQGSRWRSISIYRDLRGSMAEKIKQVADLYPHYRG